MLQRSFLVSAAMAASVVLFGALGAHAAPPSEDALGRLALAEEFASAGVKAVAGKDVSPAMVRQSAALLTAACNECDFEPRFPRLLAEACLELKDTDGAIGAIKRYRAIQLPEVQNDQFAAVELLDLYTGKQQTLDAKLNYLKPLLGVAALPDPVKSHIAFVCSNLLAQKFDSKGSAAMLAEALKLNPLSPEALQAQYVAAQGSGIPARRAEALVGLLKSNPAQPLVMGTLADELASVGQPDAAVTWYRRSFALSQDLGLGLDAGRYLNYAAALYSMDQAKSASDAANMLLASQPSNIGAATLVLLSARAAANAAATANAGPNQVQSAQDTALSALTAQLGTLHAELNGAAGAATTQAAATQPGNLIGDIVNDAPHVRALQNLPSPTAQDTSFCNGYSAALADLIFYYSYFDSQPTKASKLLDQLRLLRPADDAPDAARKQMELTRLEGFTFLADGKRAEAKVKFSAIADHDPLSKMGLLLMEAPGPDVSAQAARLVTDHPAGLLGAILQDGLRDRGGKPTETPDSTAVAAAAASFPIKLLDLLDPASTQQFYNLVAEPVHVSNAFDEPALVRVSIKNISDFDLSVGTDAAIRPDLWFDVAVQGGTNPNYPGTAYDRIAGPLVLKAHQPDLPGTDQVVRVDTGPLRAYLGSRPTIAVSMLFSVFTNPIGAQTGVKPGPGGYRQQFASPMERKASPISTGAEVSALVDPLMNGRIDQKIHTLELLADYVNVLRAKMSEAQAPAAAPAAVDPSATPPGADASAGSLPPPPSAMPAPSAGQSQRAVARMQELIGIFTQSIQNALRDPSAMVRYWAQTKLAELSNPEGRRATASMMVQGKEWEQRLLGLLLASTLPRDQCESIVAPLKSDSVSYVKDFASATLEVATAPATKAH